MGAHGPNHGGGDGDAVVMKRTTQGKAESREQKAEFLGAGLRDYEHFASVWVNHEIHRTYETGCHVVICQF